MRKWIFPVLSFCILGVIFFTSASFSAGSVLPVVYPFPEGTRFKIINAHEHIQTVEDAERLLPLMNELEFSKIILLGSPRETFFPKKGSFSGQDANNDVLLKIAKQYPERFAAFCVLYQEDRRIVQKTKNCISRGGVGIKLFSGHGTFYTIPLDDPSLEKFYDYLEKEGIPVMWHVNSSKYFDEFLHVLDTHPDLKIICPHFCLATKGVSRLRMLLEKYPNVFFDTSFGAPKILEDGRETLASKKREFREIFMKYPERFLFGTDVVLNSRKSIPYIRFYFRKNRQVLEEILELPEGILRKIYEENWAGFMGNS